MCTVPKPHWNGRTDASPPRREYLLYRAAAAKDLTLPSPADEGFPPDMDPILLCDAQLDCKVTIQSPLGNHSGFQVRRRRWGSLLGNRIGRQGMLTVPSSTAAAGLGIFCSTVLCPPRAWSGWRRRRFLGVHQPMPKMGINWWQVERILCQDQG